MESCLFFARAKSDTLLHLETRLLLKIPTLITHIWTISNIPPKTHCYSKYTQFCEVVVHRWNWLSLFNLIIFSENVDLEKKNHDQLDDHVDVTIRTKTRCFEQNDQIGSEVLLNECHRTHFRLLCVPHFGHGPRLRLLSVLQNQQVLFTSGRFQKDFEKSSRKMKSLRTNERH